ncbi:MAG: hypothetical protein R6U20_10090 [Longimonas sp.]|uniref:hypothetical protein n=1 Tax=Longimonas sp. TaxID=2039626 RepID=UPI003974F58C
MSNDTNRLLRYMYGELDDAEDIERALAQQPALFEQWFAFHEVKEQLDAQPPARPDASVVDDLVDQAGAAAQAQTDPSNDIPEAPLPTAPPSGHGDGVPYKGADTWYTVAAPSARDERPAAPQSDGKTAAKKDPPVSHRPRRAGAATRTAMQAAPWGVALMVAVLLVMSGAPNTTDPNGTGYEPMATTASSELPAWDAPDRRANLQRQAAALNERTAAATEINSLAEGSSVAFSTTP